MFIRVGTAQSGLHPSCLGFVFSLVFFVLFCSAQMQFFNL